MNKHTKGPWTIHQGTDYVGNYEVAQAIDGEHEANKRLIEVAPELLEACEALLESDLYRANSHKIVGRDDHGNPLNSAGVARNMMRKAIARAIGNE